MKKMESITIKNDVQLLDYGKSMYGGWYLNYFDGEFKGIRKNTLTELAQHFGITVMLIKQLNRRDNF